MHTEYLRPKYFYDVVNGSIYWAIEQLYKNGVDTIDALNITNMLHSNAAVKQTIEKYNLTNMQEFIDMSQYAARHSMEEYILLVNNIVTASFKRDLYRVSVEIQASCFNPKADLSDLNYLVSEKITKLTEQYITSQEVTLFGEKVEDLWEEILCRRTEDGIYGIPSKYPILSEYFTFEPGELVLLSARMKRGKSALFLNEAVHKLKNGIPVLYIDTEMQDRLFFERMIAHVSGVEIKKIKTGRYNDDEEILIRKSIEWIKNQPFVHLYLPQSTDEEIYAICKICKYKMGDDLFFIYDYIKSNMASSSEQYNLLGAKTDFLKNKICGELNIPGFAGAQLGRNMEISDSDKIARYISTNVRWREKSVEEIQKDGLECGNYCLNIDINRNGQQMAEDEYIDMQFNGNVMRIEQAKQHMVLDTPFG